MKMSLSSLKTTLLGLDSLSHLEQSQPRESSEVREPDEILTGRQARLLEVLTELLIQMDGQNTLILKLIPIPLSMVRQLVSTAVHKATDDQIVEYVNLLLDKGEYVLGEDFE